MYIRCDQIAFAAVNSNDCIFKLYKKKKKKKSSIYFSLNRNPLPNQVIDIRILGKRNWLHKKPPPVPFIKRKLKYIMFMYVTSMLNRYFSTRMHAPLFFFLFFFFSIPIRTNSIKNTCINMLQSNDSKSFRFGRKVRVCSLYIPNSLVISKRIYSSKSLKRDDKNEEKHTSLSCFWFFIYTFTVDKHTKTTQDIVANPVITS